MLIDSATFVALAGFPPDHEKSAAITLGAHFEVLVRETPLEAARATLRRVEAAYDQFQRARDIDAVKTLFRFEKADDAFWQREDRRHRLLLWYARTLVAALEAGEFSFPAHLGIDRKTTASYYTPHTLIESLLDSALEPVLREALNGAPE